MNVLYFLILGTVPTLPIHGMCTQSFHRPQLIYFFVCSIHRSTWFCAIEKSFLEVLYHVAFDHAGLSDIRLQCGKW